MTKSNSSFVVQARKWASVNGLYGPQAFLRYVIFTFMESLNLVSKDFIFKGGNLLWIYIKTPRATTDLDLVTIKARTHYHVKSALQKVCSQSPKGISFNLVHFEEVRKKETVGATATIKYTTDNGASNSFDLDIIYALPTKIVNLPSPVNQKLNIRSATLENIIADKLASVHRFKGGNTRLKDYDDLWRLSKANINIDKHELSSLLESRNINTKLETRWIDDDMKKIWKNYQSRYKDLPQLTQVFNDINQWLKGFFKTHRNK